MGQPKALLDFNGSSFIDTILNNLYIAGCDPVISVLGEDGDLICRLTSANTYQCYSNPQPQLGMLSSIKVAIRQLPEECAGFILALVDHPTVQKETYQKIIASANENPERIIIPQFFGQNGHPVFFGRNYFQQLLDASEDEGARIVVSQHSADVHFLKVEDVGIVQDIDTPEELNKYIH